MIPSHEKRVFMDTTTILIGEQTHPEMRNFRQELQKSPETRSLASLLYGSPRWEQASCIALTHHPETGKPLGMGLLPMPGHVPSSHAPLITSIWVAFDCPSREHYALRILDALARESLKRHQVSACFEILSLND